MDTNETDATQDQTDLEAERTEADTKPPKKAKGSKVLRVQVLRAIDGYHHRGSTIEVPDDEYHRGLLKQGNLKEVG